MRGIVLINIGHYGGDQSQKDTPISIDGKLFQGKSPSQKNDGAAEGKETNLCVSKNIGSFSNFHEF